MSGTPRLRSAFPETPRHTPGVYTKGETPLSNTRRSIIRPQAAINAAPASKPGQKEPYIPVEYFDPPTQRLLAICLWGCIWLWKMSNWWAMSDSSVDTLWFLLKFSGIDAAFFLLLSSLQIPWLEYSFITTLGIISFHWFLNALLAGQISVPLFSVAASAGKLVYDRELTLTDSSINPAQIIHNSSIISGRQIINLLPEGSAILNPDGVSFCLDPTRNTVKLPIRINQTTPESIELLRYDLENPETVDNILIGAKQARALLKTANKGHDRSDLSTPRILEYAVSKPGVYRLERVMDKTKLEVRRKSNDIRVVSCPQASVVVASPEKCTGDLSGVSMRIVGVPPFSITYNKRVNSKTSSSIVQKLQASESDGDTQTMLDIRQSHTNLQSQTLSFDINESLGSNGTWSYTIEAVEDGLGNQVDYRNEDYRRAVNAHHSDSVTVHKRPQIHLRDCDAEHFLMVAKGSSKKMPLRMTSPNQMPPTDWPLQLTYTFTPQSSADSAITEKIKYTLKDDRDGPQMSTAGRYDLISIDSQYCRGEVSEPSSCLLYNPPTPSLQIFKEEITDKCAGRPIGMIVNFEFTGTPPFKVRYDVSRKGFGTMPKVHTFDGMRGQLEFREENAGSYTYSFSEIADHVYSPIDVRSEANTFTQEIKPPAGAHFLTPNMDIDVCLGEPAALSLRMIGEGPWQIDYEIVCGAKRTKKSLTSTNEEAILDVPPQTKGGRCSVVLTSVQDSTRCKIDLKEERHIEVRREQPHAAFGDIDGRRTVEALQHKTIPLPLKLQGLPPWHVELQHNEEPARLYTLREANSRIQVKEAGIYRILSVKDTCPGKVDTKANTFTVSWIPRPELSIKDITVTENAQRSFFKRPVCQGDEDTLSLALTGHSPYQIKYQVKTEPTKGSVAVSNKPLNVANHVASISMDTSKAGINTYTFLELADDRYAHDKHHFTPLTVKQEIYAPPNARFTNKGKVYGYCKEELESSGAEAENIPISLTGSPPFTIEIGITHHGVSSRPEVHRVRDIASVSYTWSLSRSSLNLGKHTIQLRSVKDSRGCEAIMDSDPSAVLIEVSQPPSISPVESRTDYCVGDHIAFTLAGKAPFTINYNFAGKDSSFTIKEHKFRRIASQGGEFTIKSVSDSNSIGGYGGTCKARSDLKKVVHPFPTIRLSQGRTRVSDIHEGGEVDLQFDFTGTPPFEFTYTHSERAKGGRPGRILETRTETSEGFSKTITATDQGEYEPISIRDKYCSYSKDGTVGAGKGQKLLQN